LDDEEDLEDLDDDLIGDESESDDIPVVLSKSTK
jgi:hypothetical protein